ncbi:hypothetical protein B0H10DRAFT_2065499 [Mycena sp. CBHHK59/15]|nr:hypothetical protein B0H10DRAFT_2084219 [Mycena sp. CBHHK59/15]KAJ6609102.1 hypothetical protein B0H10DRAFT_2065499 [Mycena sp. CBHHK59/15]
MEADKQSAPNFIHFSDFLWFSRTQTSHSVRNYGIPNVRCPQVRIIRLLCTMKLNSAFSNCYICVSRASNPMKARRTYSDFDVEQAFSRRCTIHDRHGYIYIHRVKHPDGSLVLKIGRAKDVDRRLEQWQSQCYMDEIQLVWEIPCEHATKLGESQVLN